MSLTFGHGADHRERLAARPTAAGVDRIVDVLDRLTPHRPSDGAVMIDGAVHWPA